MSHSTAKEPEKLKRFLRKVQRSAQVYLLLTGVGAVVLVAAPIVALCQLFQPASSKALRAKRDNLINHVKDKVSEIAEQAKESFEGFAESFEDAIDPDSGQDWLKEHKKLHRNKTDEEWEAENGQTT